ncbi:dihydroxyacetone kinase [Geopyxis carbonaria]|nr:dihydroxyacetone kinase [Geopyxis carbonaria]
MSSKHLFPTAAGLVDTSLLGHAASHPSLRLLAPHRVLYNPLHPPSQVALISGGGAGHEPAWAGYVGANLLAASVSGDIFASPSASQIGAAIHAVCGPAGAILVITNYTGDCLHFGLACEKARAQGKRVGVVVCGDDVAVGRERGRLVGRRGLAGQIAVLKILGAAAAGGMPFHGLMALAERVAGATVSIAATLDHCHVPGRAAGGEAMLSADEIELGTGPHNEPGAFKLSPIPAPEAFVARILAHLLDPTDADRAYVPFAAGDAVVLMLSNFGGVSPLELGAIAQLVLAQLEERWGLRPLRVYVAPFETSLNAPAWSTTLINLDAVKAEGGVEKLLDWLDVRTDTAWEAGAGSQRGLVTRAPRSEQVVWPAAVSAPPSAPPTSAPLLTLPSAVLTAALTTAAEAVMAAEPDLTAWDTLLGDGDCGETLATGASAVLAALSTLPAGDVMAALAAVESIVEERMGGTLGGILGIFVVALHRGLVDSNGEWGVALKGAAEGVWRYTRARVGDRTVMDVIIPFCEWGGMEKAVAAAVEGAEATRAMKAKLGRASYVGGLEGKVLPPDPGAWGVMVALRGLWEGAEKARAEAVE